MSSIRTGQGVMKRLGYQLGWMRHGRPNAVCHSTCCVQ